MSGKGYSVVPWPVLLAHMDSAASPTRADLSRLVEHGTWPNKCSPEVRTE